MPKGLTAGQNVCNLQIFIETCQNACKMQNTCISGIFGTFVNSKVKVRLDRLDYEKSKVPKVQS